MLEWLWPSVCLGCDRTGQGWLCPQCTPREIRVHRDGPEGVRTVLSLTAYDGPVGRLVRRGKYVPDRWLVDRTAALLAERAAPVLAARGGIVVPAPSTWQSRLKRGFATGAVLARRVGAAANLPVADVLTLRAGRRQATQAREERLANLAGRLRCDTDVAGPVWLVDDVLTTGATAAEMARTLLAAGAASVHLWVLARTPAPGSA